MVRMDWAKGLLEPSPQVQESKKTLGQLEGIFQNTGALRRMDLIQVVYRVQAWCPVPEGTEGGLFWGTTVIEPGKSRFGILYDARAFPPEAGSQRILCDFRRREAH